MLSRGPIQVLTPGYCLYLYLITEMLSGWSFFSHLKPAAVCNCGLFMSDNFTKEKWQQYLQVARYLLQVLLL